MRRRLFRNYCAVSPSQWIAHSTRWPDAEAIKYFVPFRCDLFAHSGHFGESVAITLRWHSEAAHECVRCSPNLIWRHNYVCALQIFFCHYSMSAGAVYVSLVDCNSFDRELLNDSRSRIQRDTIDGQCCGFITQSSSKPKQKDEKTSCHFKLAVRMCHIALNTNDFCSVLLSVCCVFFFQLRMRRFFVRQLNVSRTHCIRIELHVPLENRVNCNRFALAKHRHSRCLQLASIE